MPTEIVNGEAAPGVFGKLPARGDFITRRLGRAFVAAWDEWLQQAVVASQSALGASWLDIYLTSPIWHFALGADCCGPNTVIGVLMPSVDKVGRYFPLTICHEIAAAPELTGLVAHAASWYEQAEKLALSTLETRFSIDELEAPIGLSLPPAASPGPPAPLAAPGIHISVETPADLADTIETQGPLPTDRTLWWSAGSTLVKPCCAISRALPRADAFVAFLDGGWQTRGWVSVDPIGAEQHDTLTMPSPSRA
jgi:type VI secretion system protein ImpM